MSEISERLRWIDSEIRRYKKAVETLTEHLEHTKDKRFDWELRELTLKKLDALEERKREFLEVQKQEIKALRDKGLL